MAASPCMRLNPGGGSGEPIKSQPMRVVDIFSKRQRRMRGEFPDVYQYDDLPIGFRRQFVFILKDVFSPQYESPHHAGSLRFKCFEYIHDLLARELGVFHLTAGENDPWDGVVSFFLNTTDVEHALYVIETSLIAAGAVQQQESNLVFKMTVDDAVKELNVRFSEHGIGYQFESPKIVRVDSKFLHQEVVKPALQLLKAKHYAGANDEFRKAHEHYRYRRYGEAVNECLKALESTLKVICKKRKWTFSDKDQAKILLAVIFKKGLVPGYLESKLTGLRTVLESGVPTIRNRESGHGAGEEPRHIPHHLAAYVLHLTASAIVFISRCDDEFRQA